MDSGRRQVSSDGGEEPVWSHSGRELFYRNGANELVAVQVSAGSSFDWDRQDVLFSMADYLSSDGHPQYDVSPDDQRFVMLRIGDDGEDEYRTHLGRELLRGASPTDGELKARIPWLRVFVEGVV